MNAGLSHPDPNKKEIYVVNYYNSLLWWHGTDLLWKNYGTMKKIWYYTENNGKKYMVIYQSNWRKYIALELWFTTGKEWYSGKKYSTMEKTIAL